MVEVEGIATASVSGIAGIAASLASSCGGALVAELRAEPALDKKLSKREQKAAAKVARDVEKACIKHQKQMEAEANKAAAEARKAEKSFKINKAS